MREMDDMLEYFGYPFGVAWSALNCDILTAEHWLDVGVVLQGHRCEVQGYLLEARDQAATLVMCFAINIATYKHSES